MAKILSLDTPADAFEAGHSGRADKETGNSLTNLIVLFLNFVRIVMKDKNIFFALLICSIFLSINASFLFGTLTKEEQEEVEKYKKEYPTPDALSTHLRFIYGLVLSPDQLVTKTRLLIAAKADINFTGMTDLTGQTALMVACQEQNINETVIKMLIEAKADTNVGDNKQRPLTALIAHQMHSSEPAVELIEYFITHGADVNLYTLFGHTPLKTAVDHNKYYLLPALFKAGADLFGKEKQIIDVSDVPQDVMEDCVKIYLAHREQVLGRISAIVSVDVLCVSIVEYILPKDIEKGLASLKKQYTNKHGLHNYKSTLESQKAMMMLK